MKSLIVLAALGFVLVGCKEDAGKHLGIFKQECAALEGTIATRNDGKLTCTFRNGDVQISK